MPAINMTNLDIYYAKRVSMPVSDLSANIRPGQAGRKSKTAQPGDPVQFGDEGGGSVSRRNFDSYECETCKNRKYQDGSNDPGVSFKTPTRLSPESAAAAVRSHENEHVSHAKTQALREDRKIISQSVSYSTAVCPECGRNYVSGGTTRTVFKSNAGDQNVMPEKGKYIDLLA